MLQSLLALLDYTATKSRCNAEELVQTVLSMVAPLADERCIRLVPYTTPALVLPLPLHQAQQLLLHIIISRVEVIAPHGTDEHTMWINIVAWDATIVLTVRDTGPSIPPSVRAQLFDPLSSTNPAIAESGLGITIVRSILQRAGGNIALTDTRPGHTTFTAWLPRPSPNAPLGDVLAPPESPAHNNATD